VKSAPQVLDTELCSPETSEGKFWAAIVYAALEQSEHVTFCGMLTVCPDITLVIRPTMLVSESVVVADWMPVSVSVRQRVLVEVSFKHAICLTVGYACCTAEIRAPVFVVDAPMLCNSVEQAVVIFVTTSDKV